MNLESALDSLLLHLRREYIHSLYGEQITVCLFRSEPSPASPLLSSLERTVVCMINNLDFTKLI